MGRTDIRIHDLRHAGQVLAAQSGATLADLMAEWSPEDRVALLRLLGKLSSDLAPVVYQGDIES